MTHGEGLARQNAVGHDGLEELLLAHRGKQEAHVALLGAELAGDLIAVATVGAFAIAVYDRSGDYNEAIAVMLFYQIGELFQSYAVGKSRKSIADMMDIAPDFANVERDGQLVQVDPYEVAVGDEIVVKAGERVPLDGVVLSGTSQLDTAALTGESVPREVREGDEIISGCVNMTGLITVRVTKPFGESTVSRILELVENAAEKKAKIGRAHV
mgnify:CR=1 FL=1